MRDFQTKSTTLRVMAAIKEQALTIPEIVKASGVSAPCVARIIDHQHDAKLIRRGPWRKVCSDKGYRWVAAYIAGRGEDVPKPAGQSIEARRAKQRVYRKNYRTRKAEADEAKHRARVSEEMSQPAFRDPFIAALFGPYEARA